MRLNASQLRRCKISAALAYPSSSHGSSGLYPLSKSSSSQPLQIDSPYPAVARHRTDRIHVFSSDVVWSDLLFLRHGINPPSYPAIVKSSAKVVKELLAIAAPSSISAADKIYLELSRSRFTYVTTSHLSKAADIPEEDVSRILAQASGVRKSFARAPSGAPYYYLTSRQSVFSDFWNCFKAINSAKYG